MLQQKEDIISLLRLRILPSDGKFFFSFKFRNSNKNKINLNYRVAPEIYNGKKGISVKSDVWSYGIVLYELFTFGEQPYPGLSNQQVIDQVPKGYQMSQPQNCPDFIYQIMKKCWELNHHNRPSFQVNFSFI